MSNQRQYQTNGPTNYMQRIDVNNPPHVPQLRVADSVAPFMVYLTGVTMDMIQAGAQGPISMHFYNHMSDNGWRNPDFDREVANIADFIYLKTGGARMDGNHAARVFPDLIGTYLNLRSMFEVQLFQGLWQFVQQQDVHGINQDISNFMAEVQQIENLRSGNQGGRPVPGPQMAARGNGYPAPNQSYQPAPAQGGYGAYGVGGGAAPGGGRDYGNAAPAAPAQQQQTHYPAPAAAAVQPQQAKQGAPMTEPSGNIVDPSTVSWNASEEMPYPMAYNPVLVTMKYQMENGKTIPLLQKTNTNMIDFDRHNITTLFGQPPANAKVLRDNGDAMRELQVGINDAREEDEAADGDGNRLSYAHALRNWAATTTLEGALQDIRTDAQAYLTQPDAPLVFQAYAQVYMPIMGKKSEAKLIKKLGDSSTYIELREKIKAAGETAPLELITEVGMLMTRHVNHMLHKELSIPSEGPTKLVVDDFTADLDALLAHLKDHYGKRVHDAFLKDQALRIRSLFVTLDPDDKDQVAGYESLAQSLLTDSWNDRDDMPAFTFFGQNIRVSLINVVSHDLQITGLAGVGNILTKSHSPALMELANAVFASENSGQLIARQLVVTSDGRILELTKAALIDGSYLVSLVK